MNLEVTGKLIAKYETQQVSEKFKKREFVLELADDINGNTYTNFAKMQLVQAKCDIIDRFNEGDQVKVSFNIKGNRWERDGKVNYITNLDAWRIEAASAGASGNEGGGYNQQQNSGGAPAYNTADSNSNGGAPFYNPSPESADDLPF